jgi:cell division protein FtsI/penicillin-binding protein 2
VVSAFELVCLLIISARQEASYVPPPEKVKIQTRINFLLSCGLLLGLAGLAAVAGWWGFIRGPDLLTRTDNPRRTISDRYVKRGSILDRNERPLAESTGQPGDFIRQYPYPALGPILGYTHPVYGQAGLEAGLDSYLRGLKGYPGLTLWWEHLLYGQPPPGLDVRLSIDQDLQTKADELLADDPGAVVLLNADSGEILAMASSPSFDANTLDANWESLVNDSSSPFFNRAGMGLYPPGNTLGAFLLAANQEAGAGQLESTEFTDCALKPAGPTWQAAVAAGCAESLGQLAQQFNGQELISLLEKLGLFTSPIIPIETLSSSKPDSLEDIPGYLSDLGNPANGNFLKVSPLQMALAASGLSNAGIRPAPRLVMAVNTPQSGWVMLPGTSEPEEMLPGSDANATASSLADDQLPIWQVVSSGDEGVGNSWEAKPGYSWFIGGTLPEWPGVPLAIAVLLEEEDPQRVLEMGQALLQAAMKP